MYFAFNSIYWILCICVAPRLGLSLLRTFNSIYWILSTASCTGTTRWVYFQFHLLDSSTLKSHIRKVHGEGIFQFHLLDSSSRTNTQIQNINGQLSIPSIGFLATVNGADNNFLCLAFNSIYWIPVFCDVLELSIADS